jgi:Zn-dependent M28 family amino/carboxypeptidase
VDRDAIAVNVNVDMIGRDPDDRLFVAGTFRQPYLRPSVDLVAARAPVRLLTGHDNPSNPREDDWTRDSDHYAFLEAGFPALYVGVEDALHHHQPTDDYETITHGFYVRAVETVIALVRQLDRDLERIDRRSAR